MAFCNELDVTSDKIVLETGTKNISLLGGLKYITDLLGTVDKTSTLTGQKNISTLAGDKYTSLLGEKYIDDLTGTKTQSSLFGSLTKTSTLSGEGTCSGFWYITVDSTYYTADDYDITIDRNP